jgi:molybdopterin-guanine dinucleotide biosynthesis protein
MKLIMVGGHSRNVGKTSVVANIISALKEFNWTAAKITQFGHGVCSVNGHDCDCAVSEHQFAITQERATNTNSDTARFLAAGARRALWVRTKQGELATALPALKTALAADDFVIVESNSLRRFLTPTLYLQVLDPLNPDFKLSAQTYFDLADAYLLVTRDDGDEASTRAAAEAAWQQVSLARELHREKPYFIVRAQAGFISPAVIDFVRAGLA